MECKNLFEKFNEGGKLLLPEAAVAFDTIGGVCASCF